MVTGKASLRKNEPFGLKCAAISVLGLLKVLVPGTGRRHCPGSQHTQHHSETRVET